ncbi:hemoglobinase-like isoform X2 [Lycorma delicatula]|uniref:hemoglobinase-like isoform X2 n=1 Tax=Lycorma delicatula TaxID=130591 RepID=UPI003F51690D
MVPNACTLKKKDVLSEEIAKGKKLWAFLVSGSDGWENYRHQADICHAYHLLIARGVPSSNIIVMIKDDIAFNNENPEPGLIFNKPDGPNVYEGVKIDYRGYDVNAKNFLDVLSGNKNEMTNIGSGRVIESSCKDTVFVNIVNHGAPGILLFPKGDLSAEELIGTLEEMSKESKFDKLIFYIEACYSGTMFDHLLPENARILANTASATDELAWALYCNYLNYPCLGDLYSYNWMTLLERRVSDRENLFNEYQQIRRLTTMSHVNLYGDYSIGTTNLYECFGPKNDCSPAASSKPKSKATSKSSVGVSSHNAALHWMKRMAVYGNDSFNKMKYSQKVERVEKQREFVDNTVDEIMRRVTGENAELRYIIERQFEKFNIEMFDCYKSVYHLFSEKCFDMNKEGAPSHHAERSCVLNNRFPESQGNFNHLVTTKSLFDADGFLFLGLYERHHI